MASTYSDLKIELIGTGEQTGTWGSTTNTNLGTALEEAITGSADVTFSSADVTLTLTNTNTTQTARNLRLVCTGTSGGARNLILGSGCQIEKLYLIQNDLADAVTVKNTTGTGVTVAAGRKQFVFNDGTNVVEATSSIIDLTTDVTGTLPIANGGTNSTATPTSGGVVYGTGSAYAITSAGTSGYALVSAGASAPTWQNVASTNTAGAIVERDGSGNFSAGTITATLSGNATTATTATTATNVSGTVAIANGGTGSTTSSGARTNLGVTATGADTTYAFRSNNLSDLSSASTARTNLGLGTMATQNSSSVSVSGGNITGLTSLTCYGAGGSSTNTVIGNTALDTNVGGIHNTAIGNSALTANNSGNYNTAVGSGALESSSSINNNTAVGFQALQYTTGGSSCVAVGYQALQNNISGNYNVAVGRGALNDCTTGYSNISIGDVSAQRLTTGARNVAIGDSSLSGGIVTGLDNTAIGNGAGLNITSGFQNTFLGSSAGSNLQTGSNVTCLGYNAEPTTTSVSNEFTLGNSSVSNLRCNDTTISSLSDARDKTDIVDSPYGLSFVNTLQPRQFKWQTRDGNIKDGSTRLGFIAQELLAATDGKNDVLDLVYESNPEKLEAKQGNLIPILVQAIKELSAKNSELEARIAILEGA